MTTDSDLLPEIQTAPRQKLILMLYDGAIEFLQQAQEAIKERDYAEAARHSQRVQDIISELNSSLDFSYGEIPRRLSLLYDFYQRQLILANLRKDPELINTVLRFMQDYRQLWAEASEQVEEVG